MNFVFAVWAFVVYANTVVRTNWDALLDIWYNFFGPHRPRMGLWGLVFLAIVTSLDTFIHLYSFGLFWAMIGFALGCLLWFILLPSVIFLIDAKNDHVRFRKK